MYSANTVKHSKETDVRRREISVNGAVVLALLLMGYLWITGPNGPAQEAVVSSPVPAVEETVYW